MINNFYIIIGFINLVLVLVLISAKNPIHRIAALVLIFLTGSFIFILLDNYFLGLTYIIVYVGAIAILFLFVIMLIEHPSVGYNSSKNNKIKKHLTVLTYPIKNFKKDSRGIEKEISFKNSYNKNIKIKEKIISSNFFDIANSLNKNKIINLKDSYKHSKIDEIIYNYGIFLIIIIILLNIFFLYDIIRENNIREVKELSILAIHNKGFIVIRATGGIMDNVFTEEIINRMNLRLNSIIMENYMENFYKPIIGFYPNNITPIATPIYTLFPNITPIATPIYTIFPNLFFPNLDFYNYFYPVWAIEFKNLTDIETLGILIYVAYPFALILVSIALWTVMIGIISICSPRRL